MRLKTSLLLAFLAWTVGVAQTLEPKPNDIRLEPFKPVKAPQPRGLVFKHGDRLAICGDSITEQKMYSRIIEDYLTMCEPELNVTVRQYGWGGERASGFLARMTNDCLRFKPTIATTCYGMNDHEYRPYEDRIGQTYRENSTAIVEAFKANGVRVIQGSPGCVGKVPGWQKRTNDTVTDLNLNLCQLRNIGIEIAGRKASVCRRLLADADGRHGGAEALRHQLRHRRRGWRASRLGRPYGHGLRLPEGLRPEG